MPAHTILFKQNKTNCYNSRILRFKKLITKKNKQVKIDKCFKVNAICDLNKKALPQVNKQTN